MSDATAVHGSERQVIARVNGKLVRLLLVGLAIGQVLGQVGIYTGNRRVASAAVLFSWLVVSMIILYGYFHWRDNR